MIAVPSDPLRNLVAIVRTKCQRELEGASDTIDVGFFHVSFTDDVMESKDDFVLSLDACIERGLGEYGVFTAERMAGGPSFIEVGGWLSDQGTALCFIALGAKYDLWTVITPATLGIERDSDTSKDMLGKGMVMLSGYTQQSDKINYDEMAVDELRERQGWNDSTMLDLAHQFIYEQGHHSEAYTEFVRGVARTENEGP